jgi:hypothetical protein
LAKDEFDTITEDKWDEDIWGVEHEDLDHKFQVPKLIFYFGEKVHIPGFSLYLRLKENRITG